MRAEDRGLTERVIEWRTSMRAAGQTARTIDARMQLLRRFTAEVAADPTTATAMEIIDWFASYNGEERRLWSPGTRRTHHANLNAWFAWLVVMDFRSDNPMSKVRSPRLPRYEAHPVSDKHLPTLLASRMHRRTRVMILLAAYAGLRVHEIAKIRGEDVDVVAGTIRVKGKGGKEAHVPLAPALVPIVEMMPMRGWWFASRDSAGHVQARSVSSMISDAMRRAHVPGTAHSLRHWFATTLVDEDVDIRTVQSLLRHDSLATTQIYTRVSDEKRRAAIGKLDIMRAVRKPAA